MYTIGKLKRIDKDSDRLEDIVRHMEKRCETILDESPNGILGIDKALRENLPKTQYVVGDIIAKEDLENKKTTLPIDKGTVEFKKPPVYIVNRDKYFYLDGREIVYYNESEKKEIFRTNFNFSLDLISSDWNTIYMYDTLKRTLRYFGLDGKYIGEYTVKKEREAILHLDRIRATIDYVYISTESQLICLFPRRTTSNHVYEMEETFIVDFKYNPKTYMNTVNSIDYSEICVSVYDKVYIIDFFKKKIVNTYTIPSEIIPKNEIAFAFLDLFKVYRKDVFFFLSDVGTFRYDVNSGDIKKVSTRYFNCINYSDILIMTNHNMASFFDYDFNVVAKIDIGTKRSLPSISMYPNKQLYMMYDDTHARRYDIEKDTSAYKVLNVNK